MKLVKSLLLGSVAGLAAVSGALAADLPSKKAAPVEYVRVCSAYGAGFFYIPGTETCLRVSSQFIADLRYAEPFGRGADAIGFRARARVQFDARTQTAYGTLRSFIRLQAERTSGTNNAGATFAPVSVSTGAASDSSVLHRGFIQFGIPGGVVTAGRVQSFYDFYANDLNFGAGTGTYGSDVGALAFAYTASFGNGFTATLSVEDAASRRTSGSLVAGQPGFGVTTYAGTRMPEVVANVRVDQAWGSAQLSGALHQLNLTNRFNTVTGESVYSDTEYGFAIQGGLKFNLPMIAAGDQLWLQAAYSDGAVSYLGAPFLNSTIGGVSVANIGDGYFNGVNGDVKKTKGYSFLAAFLHYWTPQIRQAVFGTYTKLDVATAASPVLPLTGIFTSGASVDTDIFQVGTNVVWSPVKDLDIGVEVLYARVDPKGRVFDANRGPLFSVSSEDVLEGRLRIRRDF
jgi:hypothetical protein